MKSEKKVKITVSEAFTMNARKLSELIDGFNSIHKEFIFWRRAFIVITTLAYIILIIGFIKKL